MKNQTPLSIPIHPTRFYNIINLNSQYALYITSGSEAFTKEKAYLTQPGDSLGQVWQIVRLPDNIRFNNCYEIVHARSTLVLTKQKDGEVRLKFGEWSQSQLFKLEFGKEQQILFVNFVSNENKQHLLYYDKALKLGPIDRTDRKCKWAIEPCINNPIIERSCYFQNGYSNMAIDVPQASLKDGCKLIQYYFNNRFNQRFNIYCDNVYYKIVNLNSKLLLTAHKKCREGDDITQESPTKLPRQQEWIIEYQGRNLYMIRSALNPDMKLGIKNNQYNEEAPLITTANDEFSLWKIVGYLPELPN